MKQEMLYLMVVNMPAEEELQKAKQEMEKKGEKVKEDNEDEDEE